MADTVRSNIIERCKKISGIFQEDTKCAFANGNVIASLDTSQSRDGSHGIAFYEDGLAVNLDGNTRWFRYDKIKSVQIISSFEDSFADELMLSGEDFSLRISDYSLNKSELKTLIGELIISAKSVEEKKRQTEEYAEIIAQRLAENALVNANHTDDIVFEDGEPVISEINIPREKTLPEDYKPAPIPDNEIDWLSEKPDESESEAREKIQNMSREETLSYLAQSLSEINDTDFENSENEKREIPESISQPPVESPPKNESEFVSSISQISETLNKSAPATDSEGLTIEPIWGDIYIKASKNLREVIASGKLTMEQIETELKDKLLDSVRAFAEITADESKIPKSLVARIHELKTSIEGYEQYFDSGEDIAIRAMFFMMYQMLSYSDRIAETPETKARLNDFFRRFGPAGITLSMLDMRV